MSVAFTKEQDAESVAADLPDRPISPHPNLVTARGLAQLDEALAQARAAYSAARQAGTEVQSDRTAMARATRDLRYYSARRATAQLVDASATGDVVRFGSCVTVDRQDGRRLTFQIVGEDEADPAKGAISYVSPLAAALLGKGVGDEAVVGDGLVEIVQVGSPAAF
jgi:transcription elongation GreA/GreB family factor